MAKYVTPFLVFNLGAEMVYVIAQRLEAQNVAKHRAGLGTRVVDALVIFVARSTAGVCRKGATFEHFLLLNTTSLRKKSFYHQPTEVVIHQFSLYYCNRFDH